MVPAGAGFRWLHLESSGVASPAIRQRQDGQSELRTRTHCPRWGFGARDWTDSLRPSKNGPPCKLYPNGPRFQPPPRVHRGDDRELDTNTLFTMALGLTSPWEVKELKFDGESKRLDIRHAAYLVALVPRCSRDKDGVKRVQISWARPGSGFTLWFKALLMTMVREMPVKAVARLVGVQDSHIWHLIPWHVWEARSRVDLSSVTSMRMDATASRQCQHYVSLFMDG